MVFENNESTLEYLLDLIDETGDSDVEIAYEKGKLFKKFEKFFEASKEFSKAIIHNNSFVDAYNQRALCYLALKKFDLSIIDCSKAIELTEDFNLKALL